ncbi:hypothetical protein CHGG_04354 [Chaetomium globosum CBS 148.51]|uniref:Alpha-type protein kinase domain-containing protein n=1 Tax=Chaetomium globosum (strain ATCC 6205 / CBS 148.51 / DSM 1962 / NBRC 6347 / NRRL 1970) TaxID=306901 RepID=Q2H1J2_CHAGB|nr:uncharacterized protein CHGG_04354 [Chaetomium globosum CBS 148.51]EAQ87735.1 hypothetical protein CHGG_04354 [Chaetomium globosum CBS 148.51]
MSSTMSRRCVSCNRTRSERSFSPSQWAAGEGNSRCAACVNIYGSPFLSAPEDAHYNHSSGGSVSYRQLEAPFASTKYRWLARGGYTSGPRRGEVCVVKWFKSTATRLEEDYFTYDTKAVDKATEIVAHFNRLRMVDKRIEVNVPAAWKFNDGDDNWGGRRALCEPYIPNYEKFNSNTGWKNNYWGDGTNPWRLIMQALSHFSYHITQGEYLLCDLQGGVYGNKVVLSNPVILSLTREYGVTDLGVNGINNFFHQHICNQYCRSEWVRPAEPEPYFNPSPDTTMVSLDLPDAEPKPAGTPSPVVEGDA